MTPFIMASFVAALALVSIAAGSGLAYAAAQREGGAVTMQGIGGTLLVLGLAMLGAILPYPG